jgi:hypothetical protein
MKRIAFVMVLVLLATVAFASGMQEQEGTSPAGGRAVAGGGPGTGAVTDETRSPGWGPVGHSHRLDALTQAEEAELTGIYDEIDGYPVLRVGGRTYSVGVPGYRWLDIDLEPGEEVTVEGLRLEEVESIDGHIRVSSAVIDGTEYEITPPGFGGRPGHRPYGRLPVAGYGPHAGRRYGMHPGYGHYDMHGRPGYGPWGRGPQYGGRPRW